VRCCSYMEDLIEASLVGVGGAKSANSLSKLPKETYDQSVARAFVVCFLDDLLGPGLGLSDEVKNELMHYLLLRLVRDSKS
jgi:hypothetical protein